MIEYIYNHILGEVGYSEGRYDLSLYPQVEPKHGPSAPARDHTATVALLFQQDLIKSIRTAGSSTAENHRKP